MIFKLNEKQYFLVKEYANFSDMPFIKLKDTSYEIEISKNDLETFLSAISDMNLVYGFGLDDEITPFGRELERIYDTVYNQI